jgi:CRP-like cAMP-binding protein/HEAT repeat protein
MGAGNPDLWPLAAPLLDDPDPETSLAAIDLLVRCGDFFYMADAVSSLNNLLGDEANPTRRIAGLRALQAMGDARMVRNLTRYLDDPDDGVRLQTALAIETLADRQAPQWAREMAQEALVQELADPVEGVRLSALRTLGKVGGKEALEQLMAALADPSDLVREQAGLGLLALGQPASLALEALLDDDQAPEQMKQTASLVLGQMARDGLVGSGDAQRYARRVQDSFEDTLRRIYADARLMAALVDLPARPAPSKPAPDLDGEPSPETSGEDQAAQRRKPKLDPEALSRTNLPGLDKLLTSSRRRRGSRRSPPPAGPTADDSSPEHVAALLRDGLRQRNDRRLETAFSLLSTTLRDPPSTVAVVARALRDSPAKSAARASALEALESLTSPRLARLVGRLTPPSQIDIEKLIAIGRQEWYFEPLSPGQALEEVLDDQDRWLAAIGIVLAGQTTLFDAATLKDAWLSAWQTDPVPVVQEAARTTARRLDMETKMEDTMEMAGPIALSAVERAIFLKQVPFFDGMTVDQLRTLAGIVEEQYYEQGERIYAEGDPGDTLYVMVSGRVGIERSPKRGRVQRLETLTSRQYFGERTIFDGAPQENRAVAVDAVHLLAIRREPLLALIRRAPDLSLSLVTVLSQRLRDADAKLAARTRTKPDQVMKLYDKLSGEE